jgi:hypothetical protein
MSRGRSWRGWLAAAGALAGVAVATLAILATLPRETAADRLAARVAFRLLGRDVVAATVHLGSDSPLNTVCRRLSRRREIVVAGDGRELLVSGLNVKRPSGERLYDSRLIARAYLAGCPRLLALSLGRAVFRGQRVDAGHTSIGRRAVQHLAWTGRSLRVDLFVDPRTLDAVAIHVRRRSAIGASTIHAQR